MFAAAFSQKPFSVVEYGGLRQLTEQDIEDERIKMKIVQDASVTFFLEKQSELLKNKLQYLSKSKYEIF